MAAFDPAQNGAMVEFLGTFPTLSGAPPTSLEELSDGVALFEALSEISPDYFDPSTIARHLGDNWALKASNVRKLLRNMENYYHESLHKDADFDTLSDQVNDIARYSDANAIASIIELVAAAAVTCENRASFVTRIMSLSSENQVAMKGVLETAMSRLVDYEHEEESGTEDEGEWAVDDEEEQVAASPRASADQNLFRDSQEQKELETALADARRELATYKSQAALAQEDSEVAQKKLKALVEDLQDRLVQRQGELIEAEEDLQKTMGELDDAKAELVDLTETKTQLADDLEVANAKVEQLRKAEATVVAYRRKLEGVGVMNQQMTDLEDQAASYLRQIMDLENDVKRLPTLQKDVEKLQGKVAALEQENEAAAATLKTSEVQVGDLKTQLTAAENAKKLYEEELRELKAQQQHDDDHDDTVGGAMQGLSLTSDLTNAQAKEKTMRLEIENKKLREEMEELKKLQSGAVAPAAAATVAASAASGEDASALREELDRLKGELSQKQAEKEKIGADKDKLEAYTKRTLAKFQEKYLVALQECKSKLKEKQDKIEALEGRNSSEKTAQKREEKLLSSTIYELGLTIMQNRLKER